jgi:hypothetical protein
MGSTVQERFTREGVQGTRKIWREGVHGTRKIWREGVHGKRKVKNTAADHDRLLGYNVVQYR